MFQYNPVCQNILSDPSKTCFLVPKLFSNTFCKDLLNDQILKNFESALAHYPKYYRNNDRYVVDNTTLATMLFSMVKPYLPSTIICNETSESWRLKGLNPRLRYCRYQSGQYFQRHLDGVYHQDPNTRSLLTFMIYLNNSKEYEGGRTLFYKTKDAPEIWASHTPQQGDLIIFEHNIWHEGEKVHSGEKFVLRSDILYTRTSTPDHAYSPFRGHLGYVWSLAHIGHERILSGGRDKKIHVWDHLGNNKGCLSGHDNSVLCIAKIDENHFVSGSRDKQIFVWADFTISKKIDIHKGAVLSLCMMTNETFLSGSADGTIRLLNLEGTLINSFIGHQAWVCRVCKISDEHFISCSDDGNIMIWNISSTSPLAVKATDHPALSLAYDPFNQRIWTGHLNGALQYWHLSKNLQLQKGKYLEAHHGIIRDILPLGNGMIATAAEDCKVRVWTPEGICLQTFTHQDFAQSLLLLDSATLLSASYDGKIKVWSLNNRQSKQSANTF